MEEDEELLQRRNRDQRLAYVRHTTPDGILAEHHENHHLTNRKTQIGCIDEMFALSKAMKQKGI